MTKRNFPLAKVYTLLESGPVVLLTTAGKDGPDAMALSWYTLLEFVPPLVGCVVSNRDYSHARLKRSRECVINIPTVELAEAVVGCGNTSGADTDKFSTFGLTAHEAKQVDAPLIAECYASLECRVVDTRMVNAYGFFVLEVVQAWVDPVVKAPQTIHHRGKGRFMVAGDEIRLPSKKL